MRPPLPTTTAAGSGFPVETTVTVGDESSVVLRFAFVALPGRNSCTRALTCTASPVDTVGDDEVKTNTPSDVASSASGSGSSIQKPLSASAVTTPFVDTTSPL